MLPGPVLGWVQGEGASVTGDSPGDVDQASADGGGPGDGQAAPGQGRGSPGQVVRDRDAGQPSVVGVEPARGQMGQRAVDEFGEKLLDDGVAAVWASAWMSTNGLPVPVKRRGSAR